MWWLVWISIFDIWDTSLIFLLRLKILFEDNLDGVYLKFYGKRKTGKNYGHLGMSKSLVIVTEILDIDSSKTLTNFSNSINKNGKMARVEYYCSS